MGSGTTVDSCNFYLPICTTGSLTGHSPEKKVGPGEWSLSSSDQLLSCSFASFPNGGQTALSSY
jgi:hypothetical protein